ncbi:MAG: cold shock protein CspC-like protein [Rickettsiaceae bacterium]|jgi:CspA family cold shock protein|nr:cold shock protein CspC-like protein [Rickettsiaceae bacterium]
MQSKGKIKWFNPSKGYGFICSEEVQDDIFVHLSVLKGQKIYEGDEVVFEANKCDKGFRALAVEKLDA